MSMPIYNISYIRSSEMYEIVPAPEQSQQDRATIEELCRQALAK